MAFRPYRTKEYKAACISLAGLPCWKCGRPSDSVDHDPPLSSFPHSSLWVGRLMPACRPCNFADGARIGNGRRIDRPGTASRVW